MATKLTLPAPVRCVDCASEDVESVGNAISFGNFAGGQLVDESSRPCQIYRCGRCELVFKHPTIDAASAIAMYGQSNGGIWAGSIPRPEFDLACSLVSGFLPSTRVLDVGCNGGEFLGKLPGTLKKFGVEVNQQGAARAKERGIWVWPSLDTIPDSDHFDVITCFDVIEHVSSPAIFLGQLIARLTRGGLLILSSGDASVFLAQFRPSLNWYFSNPEHICFVSRRWIEHALAGHPECHIERWTNFLHGRRHDGLLVQAKVVFFKLTPRCYLKSYRWLKRVSGHSGGLFVPGNGAAVDHFCVVVRKAGPDQRDLRTFSSNVYSQHGEDGILAEIFRRLGIERGTFCEFGAWDGKHCSNTFALYEKGWSGWYIEGNPERFAVLTRNVTRQDVECIRAFVGPEGDTSLDGLLSRSRLQGRVPDLLSIDIDSDDLAIWRSVEMRPKVVVIEFNPTIPSDVYFENVPGKCWGNSARSIYEHAMSIGYQLCAITDTNLIFVDRALRPSVPIPSLDLSSLPGRRWFVGYDGTLIEKYTGKVSVHKTGMLRLPWKSSLVFQPVPGPFRNFDQSRFMSRLELLTSVFVGLITRPVPTFRWLLGK